MSLVDAVKALEGELPPKLAALLHDLASEVESHKSLLSSLGSLSGPVGETAVQGVEELGQAVESAPAATAAHTEPSTTAELSPYKPNPESTANPGNVEQQLPTEARTAQAEGS